MRLPHLQPTCHRVTALSGLTCRSTRQSAFLACGSSAARGSTVAFGGEELARHAEELGVETNLPQLDAVKIVESFWADVWVARNPDAIDRYVVEDFVLTSGGVDIRTRDAFKQWARGFLSKILDLEFETIESFQNADGSRVASRWRVRGRNNGMFGLPSDGRPIAFTGTAVWAVRADGKLLHNWVERSAWELYKRLTN